MRLLFLDVEATGVEEEDRLIQVAYNDGNKVVNELFKPPVPIKKEAMAVHHITEKMIMDKMSFYGSTIKQELHELSQTHILVAHNAKYDLDMLAKEGIVFPTYICTLKVARYLDEGQFSNHQLQYLRYFYDLDVNLKGLAPHDALADILVLEEVARVLSKELAQKEGLKGTDILTKMIEISALPSMIRDFRFGKYNGKTVKQVAEEDSGYLKWLLGEKLKSPDGEEDWIHTLQFYLSK